MPSNIQNDNSPQPHPLCPHNLGNTGWQERLAKRNAEGGRYRNLDATTPANSDSSSSSSSSQQSVLFHQDPTSTPRMDRGISIETPTASFMRGERPERRRIVDTLRGPRHECTAYEDIIAPTCKCDVCDKRNEPGIMRCVDCGWQSCRPCIQQWRPRERGIGSGSDNAAARNCNYEDDNDRRSSTISAAGGHDGETESVLEGANALMQLHRETLSVLDELDNGTLTMPSEGPPSPEGRQQKQQRSDGPHYASAGPSTKAAVPLSQTDKLQIMDVSMQSGSAMGKNNDTHGRQFNTRRRANALVWNWLGTWH